MVAMGEGVVRAMGASGRCLSGRAVEGERWRVGDARSRHVVVVGRVVAKRSDDGSARSHDARESTRKRKEKRRRVVS